MVRRRASRTEGQAVQQDSKIYAGLDTSKLKISVAVAKPARDEAGSPSASDQKRSAMPQLRRKRQFPRVRGHW